MKSQSLSLSTVVIGVILLIVLAVVAFIFFKGTNNFSSGVNVCDSCVASASDCGGAAYPSYPIAIPQICNIPNSENKGSFCCRSAGG